jgi:hypothetical protein
MLAGRLRQVGHLCGLVVEKRANAALCFFVALRHRRHQGFHQQAGLRIGLRDHRQRLQHGEIGQRRVCSHAFGEFQRLRQRAAGFSEVLRETIGRAFGRRIDPARQHHVDHPRHADQPRQPHRSAAADENAALALRQREIGRWFGDADMRRAGSPPADHRAFSAAITRRGYTTEHPVPHLGVPQALGGVVLGQFGQVEAGGEMIAYAMDDHGACPLGKIGKTVLDRQDNAVIQRIALGRAVEAHGQHRARLLDLEQVGLTR